MSNTITKDRKNFAQIPNDLLNNPSISLTAKGLYAFMESKPSNWNFTIRSMAKQLKEGVAAISSALNELKEAGWISYTKHSDGKGSYHLFWSQQKDVDSPDHENPNLENPDQGFPMLGKPVRISNKEPIEINIDNNTPTPAANALGDVIKKTNYSERDVIELYNKICGHVLSKCIAINAKRSRAIKKITSLKTLSGNQPFITYGLESWEDLFRSGIAIPWNIGNNPSNWKADFDYLTRESVVLNILEGIANA